MKKKILSVLLSLCMVLTLMPAASGIAWAETENGNTNATPTVAVDQVTFGYAYDVQRSPAYPAKGTKVTLSSLTGPIGSDGKNGNSEGSWTLTKAGTYKYMVESKKATANLKGIVTGISSKYTPKLDEDTIAVYELKNGSNHVAYGVIVAYDYNDNSGYALFQGDTLSGSGAGYYFSTDEKETSKSYDVTANFDITSFMNAKSISLSSRDLTFDNAEKGYGSVAAQIVTITNTGNVATGDLKIESTSTDFTLDKTEIPSIGVGTNSNTATFTVTPTTGLAVGEHVATITVSGKDSSNNIQEQPLKVSFTVTEKNGGEIPETKSISVSPEKIHFEDATVGYSPVAAQTVTIKNTGNVATGKLVVKLTGEDAASFKLNDNESDEINIDSIATENGEATFTVKPKDGLPARDTYEAKITVSGAEGNTIEAKQVEVLFTVKAASSGGYYHPTIQKPTIITDDGADATLNYYGDKLTIKAKDGYDLADVLLNGVSKGKVTEVTGLRTGDKVEVKTAKKQEEPQKPTKEEIIAGVNGSRLVARSRLITLDNGKKAIRITWYDKAGMEVNFDGVEVYRSLKKNKGYGKKAFYETKDGQYEGYYINTKNLKEGTRYYYKVRGYVVLDGQKYFTEYSYKAFRTVK